MAELGYHGPAEEQCGLGASFASRLYRREPGALGGRAGSTVIAGPGSPGSLAGLALAARGDAAGPGGRHVRAHHGQPGRRRAAGGRRGPPGLQPAAARPRRRRGDQHRRPAQQDRAAALPARHLAALRPADPVPGRLPGDRRRALLAQPGARPGHVGRRAGGHPAAAAAGRGHPAAGAAVLHGRGRAAEGAVGDHPRPGPGLRGPRRRGFLRLPGPAVRSGGR